MAVFERLGLVPGRGAARRLGAPGGGDPLPDVPAFALASRADRARPVRRAGARAGTDRKLPACTAWRWMARMHDGLRLYAAGRMVRPDGSRACARHALAHGPRRRVALRRGRIFPRRDRPAVRANSQFFQVPARAGACPPARMVRTADGRSAMRPDANHFLKPRGPQNAEDIGRQLRALPTSNRRLMTLRSSTDVAATECRSPGAPW